MTDLESKLLEIEEIGKLEVLDENGHFNEKNFYKVSNAWRDLISLVREKQKEVGVLREALEFYAEGFDETCGTPEPGYYTNNIEDEKLGCGCCAKNTGARARVALAWKPGEK